MKVIDAFAGIGGFSLAADALGWDTVAFVEREPSCQHWLSVHWPGVPIYGDITTVRWEDAPACDIFTAGFPCQPHSVAGLRKASDDDRDLWGECVRAVRVLRPRYAIFENVAGLLTSESGRFFNRVLHDLAALGYDARWDVLSAAACGAPHRRERVWICAYRPDGRKGDTSGPRGRRDVESVEVATLEEWLCGTDNQESERQHENGSPVPTPAFDGSGEGGGSRSHQRRPPGQPEGEPSDCASLCEHAQPESATRGDETEGAKSVEGKNLCPEPDALPRELCHGSGGLGSIRFGEGVVGIDSDGYAVAYPADELRREFARREGSAQGAGGREATAGQIREGMRDSSDDRPELRRAELEYAPRGGREAEAVLDGEASRQREGLDANGRGEGLGHADRERFGERGTIGITTRPDELGGELRGVGHATQHGRERGEQEPTGRQAATPRAGGIVGNSELPTGARHGQLGGDGATATGGRRATSLRMGGGYAIRSPWHDAIPCRGADGTVRLIPQAAVAGPEPQVRALVDGVPDGLAGQHPAEENPLWPVTMSTPGRVARLRAIGNAVVPAWVLHGPFRYICDREGIPF